MNRKKFFLLALVLITAVFYFQNFYVRQEESIEDVAASIYKHCKNKGTSFCYDNALALLTRKTDLSFSYKVLLTIQDQDPTARTCHAIAHKMASAEIEKDPKKWRDALTMADLDDCSVGFFHGILEALDRFDPQFKVTGQDLNKFCLDKDMPKPTSCAHAYGHLLMVEYYGDLGLAIKECGQASPELANRCYSGVFMENITKINLADHGLAEIPVKDDNFLKKMEDACFQYKDQQSRACWGEIGHLYAAMNKENPKIVFNLCNRALQKESIMNCYIIAAARIVAVSNNPLYVNSVCSYYEDDGKLYSWCVDRIIGAMINVSPKNKEKAVAFCLKSKVPDECLRLVELRIKK